MNKESEEKQDWTYSGPKLSPTIKREAARQIDGGIMQLRFALAYMQKQFSAIPEPGEDATTAAKQAYAQEKVKLDAKEMEIEHQEAYRAFIRETFNV